MWTDKYTPKKLDDLIGNQDVARKLATFLKEFGKNAKAPKATLISGVTGIGKTAAVYVVVKHCGYSIEEWNASDTRNQAFIRTQLAIASQSFSLSSNGTLQKTAILIDEIDGMSGREDRGGLAELIKAIKETKVPIVCIANDASNPKLKSLKTHCLLLPWQIPTAQQISGRLLDICAKEGLKSNRGMLEAMATACRFDIRQMLNSLQLYRQTGTSFEDFDVVRRHIDQANKDLEPQVFDVARRWLTRPPPRKNDGKWLTERTNEFFSDSDLMPLMVQENYASPDLWGKSSLDQLAQAADDISAGDCLERGIRVGEDYSLMPIHAIVSSIAPAYRASIALPTTFGRAIRVNFPSWLGKQSTMAKSSRQLTELQSKHSLMFADPSRSLSIERLAYCRTILAKGGAEDYNFDDEDVKALMKLGHTLERKAPAPLQPVVAKPKRVAAKKKSAPKTTSRQKRKTKEEAQAPAAKKQRLLAPVNRNGKLPILKANGSVFVNFES